MSRNKNFYSSLTNNEKQQAEQSMSNELVPWVSNNYEVEFWKKIYTYKFVIEGWDESLNPSNFIGNILTQNNELITNNFNHFIIHNTNLLSPVLKDRLEFTVKIKEISYKVLILNIGEIEDNIDIKRNVYGRFLKRIQHKLQLKQINRNYYDPSTSINFYGKYKLMKGFSSKIHIKKNLIYWNIDLSFKLITNNSVYNKYLQLRDKYKLDYEIYFEDILKNTSVITKYNNNFYRVTRVDYNMTPKEKFLNKRMKEEVSFKEYYEKRYNIKIKDENQPLLLVEDEKKNLKIHLIPELCFFTGISEEDSTDFKLKRELTFHTNKRPDERFKEINNFSSNIRNSLQNEFSNWQVKLSSKPKYVDTTLLDPGLLIMKQYFDLNNDKDRIDDRIIQNEPFEKPTLKIKFFYSKYLESNSKAFIKSFLSLAEDEFKLKIDSDCDIVINKDYDIREWEDKLGKLEYNNCNLAVFILDGKREGKLYKEIKNIMFTHVGVPSQVILANTIRSKKNMQSIIAKMIIQIVAKHGLTPWRITMPVFSEHITMAVGITRIRRKNEEVYFSCSTNDETYSKIYSVYHIFDNKTVNNEKNNIYRTIINSHLKHFHDFNEILPQKVYIYQDYIIHTNKKVIDNIDSNIKESIDYFKNEYKVEVLHITMISVSKSKNYKFYNDKRDKIKPYSMYKIFKDISIDNLEFYLLKSKLLRGINTPVLYRIIVYQEDNKDIGTDVFINNLSIFTFKLSLLYYNSFGPTNYPAPLYYSIIMGKVWTKLSSKNKIIDINSDLPDNHSLYYI